MHRLSVTFALVALSGGCVDPTSPAFPFIEETTFAPSLGIDLSVMTRTAGGMYWLDLEEGSGALLGSGQRVDVAYRLFVPDGRLVETADEVRFEPGCREVVAGLDAGVRGMRESGQRRLVVPGRLGYGLDPPPELGIGDGAILVYEVDALRAVPVEDPC